MTLRTFLKSRHFLVFISIIIICICFYVIGGIYGFSAYPDEFGYWAPAARLKGYDWSQVASIGSYYSYGYSIILYVILSIFKDGIIAYRAAIILNFMLQCAAVWIIYIFICNIRNIKGEGRLGLSTAILSAIAVLYPAWSLYSQSTMAESLVCFLFVLVSYLVFRFLRNPGILNGILLAACSMYLYLVHMRMIGCVVAIVITLLVWALYSGKRSTRIGILGLIAVIAVIFAVSFMIKSGIVSKIYTNASTDTINWNDYNGQIPKLAKLFSLKGLLYVFDNICGKILYISLATYGIGICGLGGIIALFVASIKSLRKRGHKPRALFEIYIFLAVFGQIAIAIIYLIDSPSPDNPRLDLLLHGRYTDMLIPVLMIYGIYSLYSIKHPLIYTTFVSLADILLSIPIFAVIDSNNTKMSKLQGFTTAGVSYMLFPGDTDARAFLVRAVALGIALSYVVCLVIIVAKKTNEPVVIAAIFVIQLALTIITCNKYLYSIQPSVYTDILVTRQVEKLKEQDLGRQIIHIYEGGVQYIEVMQFNMRDQMVDVINTEYEECDVSALPMDAIIVTGAETTYDSELCGMYDTSIEYGHLNVYFNAQ